jgi:hypothetical protein
MFTYTIYVNQISRINYNIIITLLLNISYIIKFGCYSTIYFQSIDICEILKFDWGCRDRDSMVVGFTTTYAISAYHH